MHSSNAATRILSQLLEPLLELLAIAFFGQKLVCFTCRRTGPTTWKSIQCKNRTSQQHSQKQKNWIVLCGFIYICNNEAHTR